MLHLPPILHKSILNLSESTSLSEKQMPKNLLILVNQGSTCGELLDFCNQILTDNAKAAAALKTKAMSQASK